MGRRYLGAPAIASALLLTACGTTVSPVLPVGECISLLPASVTGPTPKVPIPPVRTAGTLAAFADATEGQLDKANANNAEIVGFDARCKARDVLLIKSITKKPWWKLF